MDHKIHLSYTAGSSTKAIHRQRIMKKRKIIGNYHMTYDAVNINVDCVGTPN